MTGISGFADCPACHGRGEIQTGLDYFGQPITLDCLLCRGRGEVTADVALHYLEGANVL